MSRGKLVRQIGLVTTIPMIFAAGPLVGYWIGQWIDRWLKSDPWGTVILALLGLIASVKQVVQVIQRWIKENKD